MKIRYRLYDWLILNVANFITVAGLTSVVWTIVILTSNGKPNFNLVIGLAIFTALTDWFDGFISRKWKIESVLGSSLDKIRDKIFVTFLIAILAFKYLPPDASKLVSGFTRTVVIIVILAEITSFVGLLIGLAKKIDTQANIYGKWKMGFETTGVLLWLITLTYFPQNTDLILLIDIVLLFAFGLALKSLEGYWSRLYYSVRL